MPIEVGHGILKSIRHIPEDVSLVEFFYFLQRLLGGFQCVLGRWEVSF